MPRELLTHSLLMKTYALQSHKIYDTTVRATTPACETLTRPKLLLYLNAFSHTWNARWA